MYSVGIDPGEGEGGFAALNFVLAGLSDMDFRFTAPERSGTKTCKVGSPELKQGKIGSELNSSNFELKYLR